MGNLNLFKTKIIRTKAETLLSLSKFGYSVPKVFYFSMKEWKSDMSSFVQKIQKQFINYKFIAIRSSSQTEDSSEKSMAGVFESILNIDVKNKSEIINSVNTVINSFDDNPENQILIQPMVENVAMSGVAMTKVLDDGSPYYVINFDDSTGRTDTVTSGNSINKTVYVYNGFKNEDFDSPYLLKVLMMIRKLESHYKEMPLDIEFAVDKEEQVYLLQVRPITTSEKWNTEANKLVSERLPYLEKFVKQLMGSRTDIFGNKTLLGIMPDWNPAEMIGVVPHPLAMSLYRELITKRAWSHAREEMGYKMMPDVELMVSLFGRAYIDVRNSMNSFLPDKLNPIISEKLINAYIERLENNPHLHDKIEFEVVQTAYDFKFEENLKNRYPNLLNKQEYLEFKSCMIEITQKAIENTIDNSLNQSFEKIEKLKKLQNKKYNKQLQDPFSISDHINTLIDQCIKYGTTPFSIAARHGFIAETLLRSAIAIGAIEEERVIVFKRSVKTISTEMSEDFYDVCNNNLDKDIFIEKYGHLRPSSYDILSPTYKNREDLFNGDPRQPNQDKEEFELTNKESDSLNKLLKEHGFERINAEDLFIYAAKSIKGREYQKFVFTKHLSNILEYVAKWGERLGFTKQDMAMLSINEILSVLFSPLTADVKSFFKNRIEKANRAYDVASSFKLNYLIRSLRDIYIAPIQRSTANFVGNKRIEGEVVFLTAYMKEIPNLKDKIICIEGADPGYDWIFSRNIAGLITKFGGVNSHMAIRCAEYGLPAAIGCGEQPFEKIVKADKVLLDCQGERLEPHII